MDEKLGYVTAASGYLVSYQITALAQHAELHRALH